MKNTIEKLIRKNEKLKCKLMKMRKERVKFALSVMVIIVTSVAIELYVHQVKNNNKGV